MVIQVLQPFEAVYAAGVSGLLPGLEVALVDNDNNVIIGPTGVNIDEIEVASVPTGVYTWNYPSAPATVGQYSIIWSPAGDWDPETTSTADELVVVEGDPSDPFQPIPEIIGGGLPFGPSTRWTTTEAVAACCSADVGSDPDLFDDAVDQASQLLFALSGHQFTGIDDKTVRPPCVLDCWCNVQILSKGHIVGDSGCQINSCYPSRVLLSGYPVRAITQVKINGAVIDPGEYRVEGYRWAVRRNNHIWPSHQNFSLDATEDDTWSITYTYGQNPPLAGQLAATELACELYKSCNSDLSADCQLPNGVTRITRQGITFDRPAFLSWAWSSRGGWQTGMAKVDLFLNAYNPNGIKRRPTIVSPDGPRYAQVIGV